MPDPSTIQILVNDTDDVTRHSVFAQSRFEMVGSGIPGTGRLILKDSAQELSFTTGDEIALVIDGVKLWGGLMLDKGEGHFFPVVDTSDLDRVYDLQWQLNLSDFNFWMQRRVVRDTSNYLNIPWVTAGKVGAALREAIPQYMDVPPGLDYTSKVDNTDAETLAGPIANDLGEYWSKVLDQWAAAYGLEWRIDADKRLHLHTLERLVSPWGFTDHNPNGVNKIGFREGTIREDGLQMVTDALVWGGSVVVLEGQPEDMSDVYFARYPDPPANSQTVRGVTLSAAREQKAIDRIAEFGRWQRAETHFNQVGFDVQAGVTYRAASIVSGATGTDTVPGDDFEGMDIGLWRPVWQVKMTWFAHDVPGRQHLVPGHIVPFTFWTMEGENGRSPLTLWLPLRTLSISFPTIPSKLPDEDPLTYVRFDGEFGISYSDSRFLWRQLRALSNSSGSGSQSGVMATVSESSSYTVTGALGGFTPIEPPDASRVVFSLPFGYLQGTTEVYLNALIQRPNYEYVERSPGSGQIEFATAPFPDDTIWVVMRTAAG